jgi:hypothetical protein
VEELGPYTPWLSVEGPVALVEKERGWPLALVEPSGRGKALDSALCPALLGSLLCTRLSALLRSGLIAEGLRKALYSGLWGWLSVEGRLSALHSSAGAL